MPGTHVPGLWRGLILVHTSQRHGTMHIVVQCSYSSHSAFRARNESHSWFGQSNSTRGMEIKACNVGITADKRKEGGEERFWPELKCPGERMHFGCAFWPQPLSPCTHSAPHSCLMNRLLPTQTKDPEGHGLSKNHCAPVRKAGQCFRELKD